MSAAIPEPHTPSLTLPLKGEGRVRVDYNKGWLPSPPIPAETIRALISFTLS